MTSDTALSGARELSRAANAAAAACGVPATVADVAARDVDAPLLGHPDPWTYLWGLLPHLCGQKDHNYDGTWAAVVLVMVSIAGLGAAGALLTSIAYGAAVGARP